MLTAAPGARRPVLVTLAALCAAAAVTHLVPGAAGQLAVPVCGVLLLCYARVEGISWSELGLGRRSWRSGARTGAAVAAVTAGLILLAALLPWTRSLFLDDRYHHGWAAAALAAFVEIPLQTVLPEEIAFRSVLLGSLLRRRSARASVAVSALLFGLWHIPSLFQVGDSNQGLGASFGSGAGRLVAALGVLVATTVAGVLLGYLRIRSRSVLAPVALHWALNGAAVLAAGLAWSLA